jgi:hypothetical protein
LHEVLGPGGGAEQDGGEADTERDQLGQTGRRAGREWVVIVRKEELERYSVILCIPIEKGHWQRQEQDDEEKSKAKQRGKKHRLHLGLYPWEPAVRRAYSSQAPQERGHEVKAGRSIVAPEQVASWSPHTRWSVCTYHVEFHPEQANG